MRIWTSILLWEQYLFLLYLFFYKQYLLNYFQISGDVTRLREDAVKRCKELNITIQPYIIVVGPSIKDIQNSFVCIDDVLYNTASVLEAVDVCFKAFQVLQLNYPAASEHLWIIIQKCFYKFITKWDYIIPHIENIIKNFENKVDVSSSEDV